MRSLASAVVFCLLSVVAMAGQVADAGAASASAEITRESVVSEINRHRAQYGLDPLRADERLHLAAQDRIEDMELVGYWAHESPEGTPTFIWLKKHSYQHRIAGENLATGLETAGLLVESWMESPGHRANILSPEFHDIGVAWIEGGTTRRLTGRSVVVIFAREIEEDSGEIESTDR